MPPDPQSPRPWQHTRVSFEALLLFTDDLQRDHRRVLARAGIDPDTPERSTISPDDLLSLIDLLRDAKALAEREAPPVRDYVINGISTTAALVGLALLFTGPLGVGAAALLGGAMTIGGGAVSLYGGADLIRRDTRAMLRLRAIHQAAGILGEVAESR